MINLAVATKNGEGQMGITSILSAIVLQFLLIVPMAVVIKMYRRDTHSLAIFQPHHSILALFLPAILVGVVVGLAYWQDQMVLQRKGIYLLLLAYAAFVIQQLLYHLQDSD